jgi:hypothetical protein
MPKITYRDKRFHASSLAIIDIANTIINEYQAQGFDLTLRQLYYQFVARDLLPNTQKSYDKLGVLISDARLAGLVDWNAIVDRTRELCGLPTWDDPQDIVREMAREFRTDLWADQPSRVEVWFEKDALAGVFAPVCNEMWVDFFSCRGYVSQSAMWRAGRRMLHYESNGQSCYVLHLGDHDPSGLDMTRDIQDRFILFGADVEVRRIALNMDQVQAYGPPPNPAKITDSRAREYIAEHGTESWELDALEPTVLAELVRSEVMSIRDNSLWDDALAAEHHDRKALDAISINYGQVVAYLESEGLL